MISPTFDHARTYAGFLPYGFEIVIQVAVKKRLDVDCIDEEGTEDIGGIFPQWRLDGSPSGWAVGCLGRRTVLICSKREVVSRREEQAEGITVKRISYW